MQMMRTVTAAIACAAIGSLVVMAQAPQQQAPAGQAPAAGAQQPQGGGRQGRGGGGGAANNPASFFVTSVGKGDGANYGGLAGADAYCARACEGRATSRRRRGARGVRI